MLLGSYSPAFASLLICCEAFSAAARVLRFGGCPVLRLLTGCCCCCSCHGTWSLAAWGGWGEQRGQHEPWMSHDRKSM